MVITPEDDRLVSGVLLREGGYGDLPQDPGGCTNMGITLEMLRQWRHNPDLSCQDLKALTIAEAKAIYADRYLHATGIAQLPDLRLRELVLDFAVHSGPWRAVRELQRVVHVEDDGELGPETLAAVASFPPEAVWLALWKRRLLMLVRLVESDQRRLPFLVRWVNRMLGLL